MNKQGIQGSLEFIILDFSLVYKVLCRVMDLDCYSINYVTLCCHMLGMNLAVFQCPFKCLVSGSQNNEFILSKIKGKRKKEKRKEGRRREGGKGQEN